MNGFKYIIENAYLFKLSPGQFIYHESQPVASYLYFIIHGSFIFESKETGNFGSIMCIGHTLGEEVLFGEEAQQ